MKPYNYEKSFFCDFVLVIHSVFMHKGNHLIHNAVHLKYLIFLWYWCRLNPAEFNPIVIKDLLAKYQINITKQEVSTLERYCKRSNQFPNVYALLKSYF